MSSETELLLRIGARDHDAFAQFYDRTVQMVFGVARRFLHDEALAEDLVQEVYLQVWEKGASYNPALGKPMTWLMTLTRNRAVDRLRASARTGELPMDEMLEVEGRGEPDRLDAETAKTVRRAVEQLPTEQRRALEMAFFGGLTQAEIAAQLKEPLGTIKARIRRAMLGLRETLKHCAEF
jgi:RNA polymerase sigma-70 factor (ECF subfamily)